MTIKVELDYAGNPYLRLVTSDDDIQDQVLENFIRRATEVGLIIKNESSFENDYSYATIKLGDSPDE